MRKRPGPDRIASILREMQADLYAGLSVNQACRKVGYATTTYYCGVAGTTCCPGRPASPGPLECRLPSGGRAVVGSQSRRSGHQL